MKIDNKDSAKDDEIHLGEVATVFWKEKYKILLFSFFFSSLIFLISFSFSDVYKSEAVLASSEHNNLGNNLNKFSGVASLAGLNIPSGGEIDKIEMGIEIMSSLDFFEKFSSSKNIFFLISAVKGWDKKNDTYLIDEAIYDSKSNQWVSKDQFSIEGRPSLQKTHEDFMKSLNIEKDLNSGFLKVSYTHFSPKAAKIILEELIFQINELVRQKDIEEAEISVEFLQREMTSNKFLNIKNAMSNLIEGQMETIMIANASKEYLFEILSSPFVPEKKYSPDRYFIALMSFILGFLLSLSYFFSSYYLIKRSEG